MQPEGPAGRFTAREVLDLLIELPDDSAFIASVRASNPPAPTDTVEVTALRARRRWRGWTTDRELLAQIRDLNRPSNDVAPFPRPDTDTAAGAQVVDIDALLQFLQ